MQTSIKGERRSGWRKEEGGIGGRRSGRRQRSRSRFGCPRCKCGVITCTTSGEPRYGEQHNTPTFEAMTHREGKQANTAMEKEEML